VDVEYTDSSSTSSGWVDAPEEFVAVTLELASSKTVKYVKLYALSNTGNQTAMVDYDYAAVLMNPPLEPGEVFEVDADLITTTAVSGLTVKILNDILLGVTHRRYTFEEGFGTRTYDLSPNRHQSKLVNATFTSNGKHGKGVDFSSTSSSRLETGFTTTLPAGGALSFGFWVKAQSGASGVVCGFGKAVGGDWNRIQVNWTGDKLRLYAKDDSANYLEYVSTVTVADNQWHHVLAVVDPSSDLIQLYIDGTLDGGDSDTLVAITLDTNDLTFGCLHNDGGYSSYTDMVLDDAAVYGRALTAIEAYKLSVEEPLSGVARVRPGCIVMVYLAAVVESLVCKLVTARVIDRVSSGDPDEPTVVLICDDLGELLLDRTFTKEYATDTQIHAIVDDVLDDEGPEFYQDKDSTNRTIQNRFNEEGVWSLLRKLAETASFASGEKGANFYVDPGGALRFRRYGAFTCSHRVTDGSDGYAANILDIRVKESIKGNPRLVNDVKVIIFEEESLPVDEDSYTESADSWSSPDPTDSGYPLSDTGDLTKGTASIHFNTTSPGNQYRMRVDLGEMDLTGMDRLKFDLKWGGTLNPQVYEVYIKKTGWIWNNDYYWKGGITPGSSGSWPSIEVDLGSMNVVGNPGNIVNNFQLRAYNGTGLGTGGFLIDHLRFTRDEKSGTASDSGSQSSFGRRKLRVVDKTITDTGYADYVAGNLLEHRKNPLVTVRALVPGRGQTGYRPPMMATVTCLKDGLDQVLFQIQRARHRYTPGEGYTCELEMVAARKPDGSYEAKVAPGATDFALFLADRERRRREEELNSLQRNWI